MGKKVISNTFNVNIIEDGNLPQQIFYRNPDNQEPSTPATSQSDAVPSGWSATPQGVGGVYKYEWVSMRTKTNGVWGVYSTPALYAYLAEDGTSFNIKGSAITLEIGDANDVQSAYEEQSELSKTEKGDVILGSATHTDSGDHYILRRTDKYWDEDRERYAYFVFESVQEGEAYVISAKQSVPTSYDGHFFLASPRNDDVASGIYYWKDLGYLKGVKGDDAVMYVLEPSIPQFNTDQGRTKVQTCTIRAYKIEGKTKSAFTGCFEINPVLPSGMIGQLSYSWGNNVSLGTNYDRNATAYDVSLWDKDPRYITVDEPEPVLLASITIPIAFDGVQGKMGRNLWFAGLWSDVAGQTFSVDDHNAPYVQTGWADTAHKIPVCKVFVGANGNFTYPSTVAGYENNVNWGAMVSDFEYLITKAVFAALAKLGSWTFNSDYMYSDLGLNHSSQQESAQGNLRYDGIGDSDNTWTPNVSIDAANGRASFGRDKVRFNPDGGGWLANKNIQWDANGNPTFNGIVNASGGTFHGVVTANLMYVPTKNYLQSGDYTITVDENSTNSFYIECDDENDRSHFTLPTAANYNGLELTFYYNKTNNAVPPIIMVRDGEPYITFRPSTSFYVADIDPSWPADLMVEWQTKDLENKPRVMIFPNQEVKIKAMNNRWFVMYGYVSDGGNM